MNQHLITHIIRVYQCTTILRQLEFDVLRVVSFLNLYHKLSGLKSICFTLCIKLLV